MTKAAPRAAILFSGSTGSRSRINRSAGRSTRTGRRQTGRRGSWCRRIYLRLLRRCQGSSGVTRLGLGQRDLRQQQNCSCSGNVDGAAERCGVFHKFSLVKSPRQRRPLLARSGLAPLRNDHAGKLPLKRTAKLMQNFRLRSRELTSVL